MIIGVIGNINMKILGLDASTRITGYGLVDESGKLLDHGVINLYNDKEVIEDRIKKMMISIHDLIKRFSPDVIYVEEMWSKLNVQVTKQISYVIGATMGFSAIQGYNIHLVLPSEWRKVVGLSQSKKKREELKQEAIEWVKTKYGIDVGDDEAEGICIAHAGHLLLLNETVVLFE